MTAENSRNLLFLDSPNLAPTFRELAEDLEEKGIRTSFADGLDIVASWVERNKDNPNSTWVVDWEALPVGGVHMLIEAKRSGFAGRIVILTLNAKSEFLGDCHELGCQVELKPLQDLEVLESARESREDSHE